MTEPDDARTQRAVQEQAARRVRAVHDELLARAPEDRMQPRLDPVRDALHLLGDPQDAYPVIHLTGTNGKTSTARVVERVLREHNLRTGRLTSPHLHSVTERISVDGSPLTDDAFADVHEDVSPVVAIVDGRLAAAGEPPLTYFEVLVVMAFAAFAEAPVDVAVVEVGLGGTWDATNVAHAAVAVVTPVSLDHTEVLGGTVAAIAGEKAGIFEEGGLVVLAQQPVDAAEVLMRRAVETGSTVVREGIEFGVTARTPAVGGQQLTVQGLAGEYRDLFLPLLGEHQAHNTAVAVAAVEAFLGGGTQPLDVSVLADALEGVTSPGRLELVRPSPPVLVDAAHNPAGAQSLVDAVEESFDLPYVVAVVGVLRGKDAENLLAALEPLVDAVVVTRSSSPRSMEVHDLAAVAREVMDPDDVHEVERLDDALALAVDLAETGADRGGGVVVTGSVTLAAEARTLLRAPGVDAEVAALLAARRSQEPT